MKNGVRRYLGRENTLPNVGFGWVVVGVASLGLFFVPLGGYGATKNPYQNDPKAIEEGKKIWFSVGCTGCHGAGGGGGMCPSVGDDIWVFGGDDETLFRLIKGQIPQQTMPRTFGQILSDDQIWKVLAFVRTLKFAGGSSGSATGVPGASMDAHGPTTVSIPMEERSCAVIAANRRLLTTLLPSVPGYRRSYVCVLSSNLSVDSIEGLVSKKAQVRAEKGFGEALAKRWKLPVQAFDDSVDAFETPVEEILAGKLDAAILWAPMAGFALWHLDKGHKLKVLPLKETAEPPEGYRGQSGGSGYVEKCAQAIAAVLGSYGVKPSGS
ncbi:c-type cytochrome [Candidatus Methylacidithermus pantelleriae]|nr:c-type cytochrome [Candidatus Methylacidithermus pantelleriae]